MTGPAGLAVVTDDDDEPAGLRLSTGFAVSGGLASELGLASGLSAILPVAGASFNLLSPESK